MAYDSALTDAQRARLKAWGEQIKNERTRDCYIRDVGPFLAYCEGDNKTVVAKDNAIKVAQLASKWLLNLKGQSQSSLARKASAIRAYLAYCGMGGVTEFVYKPKIKNLRTALLDPLEVDKLFDHPKVTLRMRALLFALSLSPLTLDQCLSLRLKDLEMSAGVITGPFFDEVTAALKSYRAMSLVGASEAQRNGLVFRSYTGKALSRQAAWKEIRNAGYLMKPPMALNCNKLKTSYILRVYCTCDDMVRTAEICGLPLESVRRLVNTVKARKAKNNAA